MDTFNISVQRFDEFAAEYAARLVKIDDYLPSIELFCNVIENEKPTILELACGPGNVTGYLNQKFPESEIIAIDLAPKMIEIARQQLPNVDFRVMDVRNISSLNQKFDAIMCSFCLPFLSKADANQLIADCANLLNENGAIYISTMEGDESRAGFETTSFSGDAKVYFNYHNQSALETSFLKCGFKLMPTVRQDYIEPDGSITTDLIFIGKKAIKLIRDNSRNADFQALVKLLDAELNEKYGIIQAQYEQYNKTDGIETVVIGYMNNQPAGCGCFKVYDQNTIEIKRMLVKPEFRGTGLAKLILLELEKWGIEKGFSKSILETGTKQPDAMRFYDKLGYVEIENYGQYIGNTNSICMSKKLSFQNQSFQ